jgi:putative integral membrane protein (TIGR02587 family)
VAAAGDWAQEADDLARGIGGGMLFGIPLVYTMEVWWLGGTTRPAHLLVALLITFVPVALLIRSAGFRREQDVRAVDALMDAVEAVALGVVVAGLLLVVLGEIGPGVPLADTVGKLVYEAAPFAIGVAVARHVLGGARDSDDERSARARTPAQATAADLGATLVGALFVAFNVAPTDEIPMLAAAATPPRLLGLVGLSLAASYVIVFVAGFGDQPGRRDQAGLFQHPVTETVAAYVVSLIGALAMLWFFQRLTAPVLSSTTFTQVLLLGLPAAVGGAAGRLAA